MFNASYVAEEVGLVHWLAAFAAVFRGVEGTSRRNNDSEMGIRRDGAPEIEHPIGLEKTRTVPAAMRDGRHDPRALQGHYPLRKTAR